MVPFISESHCQLELGHPDPKRWREFLEHAGLTVYELPGGYRVLQRSSFYSLIAGWMSEGRVPAASHRSDASRGRSKAAA